MKKEKLIKKIIDLLSDADIELLTAIYYVLTR